VFAADSLFCEWGYVINLDDNLFEVYKGFNKDALDEKERFASLTVKDDNSGYKQIKFVKAYPLDNLPEGHQMGDEIEELVSDEEEEKSENATDSMDIYLDGNHVETRYVDKTDIQSFVNDMVTLSFDNKGKKVLVYRNEVEFLKLFIKPDDN
jgi:hypothetical protein